MAETHSEVLKLIFSRSWAESSSSSSMAAPLEELEILWRLRDFGIQEVRDGNTLVLMIRVEGLNSLKLLSLLNRLADDSTGDAKDTESLVRTMLGYACLFSRENRVRDSLEVNRCFSSAKMSKLIWKELIV